MKVTVECPVKSVHESFKQAVLNNAEPKYTFLGPDPKSKQPSMMFEADTDDKDAAIKKAKAAIQASEKGKLIGFRTILSDDRFYMPK